eukprot:TRINITY_DN2963_c0_g1_i4.p4 TRINITY_DN2963_c0_g1~~TRINITY_DN2963_c0_g1_i4.p4  ORF type:complete len:252 (+),score=-26.25 TRINITY_DN2963_c0_g1_i4:1518-2273(+)
MITMCLSTVHTSTLPSSSLMTLFLSQQAIHPNIKNYAQVTKILCNSRYDLRTNSPHSINYFSMFNTNQNVRISIKRDSYSLFMLQCCLYFTCNDFETNQLCEPNLNQPTKAQSKQTQFELVESLKAMLRRQSDLHAVFAQFVFYPSSSLPYSQTNMYPTHNCPNIAYQPQMTDTMHQYKDLESTDQISRRIRAVNRSIQKNKFLDKIHRVIIVCKPVRGYVYTLYSFNLTPLINQHKISKCNKISLINAHI